MSCVILTIQLQALSVTFQECYNIASLLFSNSFNCTNNPNFSIYLRLGHLITSFKLFNNLICIICWFYKFNYHLLITIYSCVTFQWWRDVTPFQGLHTSQVYKNTHRNNLVHYFWNLILSFFWTYFHSSLFPSIEIIVNYYPFIKLFNSIDILLMNIIIL